MGIFICCEVMLQVRKGGAPQKFFKRHFLKPFHRVFFFAVKIGVCDII
jgi:hypothetical protein